MTLVYFFTMYPESTDGEFLIIGGAILLQSIVTALVIPNVARDTIVISGTGITFIRGWFFHFLLAKYLWSDFSGEITDGDTPVFNFTEERKQKELLKRRNKNVSSNGLQLSHFQLSTEALEFIKGKIKK